MFRVQALCMPRTAMDPGERVGSASGAEGRRFESCRGHHLTSADANPCKIREIKAPRRGSEPDWSHMTTTTNPYPDVPLPAGAIPASDWGDHASALPL